jgi:hypothetical protein
MYVNAKMIPVKTVPGREDEREQWSGEFKYDVFITL